MSLPLKWEFPGGKIENGESKEECIVREIKEELNLDMVVLKKLHSSVFDYPNLEKYRLLNLDWTEADIPSIKEYLSL